MASAQNIRHASRVLHGGGVIAYPTEGVYGLGCLPGDYAAVSRILEMKSRSESQGLILIGANAEQLSVWAELPDSLLTSSEENPVTWIVPATDAVPDWIRGDNTGVAVRITAHPVAGALCAASGSCLVSTSANLSGHEPARNMFVLRKQFGALVDYVVPGSCGPAAGASEIRDSRTGNIVRSA